MLRKNSRISARASSAASSSSVSAEPLMAISGARSSWLTRPGNSVRMRSIWSSGARARLVTTTDPISPPSAGIKLTALIKQASATRGGTAKRKPLINNRLRHTLKNGDPPYDEFLWDDLARRLARLYRGIT